MNASAEVLRELGLLLNGALAPVVPITSRARDPLLDLINHSFLLIDLIEEDIHPGLSKRSLFEIKLKAHRFLVFVGIGLAKSSSYLCIIATLRVP